MPKAGSKKRGGGISGKKKAKTASATKSQKEATKPTQPHLSSAVQTLTENGWLSAKDLCRLEQTSKGYARVVAGSWRALCSLTWPTSGKVEQAFIEKLGGYKTFYRNRKSSYCAQDKFSNPMNPPKLRFRDIGILFDVAVKGKDALSFDLISESREKLIQHGMVKIKLRRPFVVSTARCWMKSECNCKVPCALDQTDFSVKMHLLRSGENASMCCIYGPPHRNIQTGAAMNAPSIGDPEKGVYEWKHNTKERIYLRLGHPAKWSDTTGLALQPTKVAAEIRMRLGFQVFGFNVSMCFEIIEPGDKVAITDFHVRATLGDCRSGKRTEYNKEKAEETGVSILHILEQLQGIENN